MWRNVSEILLGGGVLGGGVRRDLVGCSILNASCIALVTMGAEIGGISFLDGRDELFQNGKFIRTWVGWRFGGRLESSIQF